MFKDYLVALFKVACKALRKYAVKNKFLAVFSAVVLLLALVRLLFPSVAENKPELAVADSVETVLPSVERPVADSVFIWQQEAVVSADFPLTVFFDSKGNVLKHKINSVPGFSRTFPDNNDVQLVAASTHGVEPVEDRKDAESRKKELVYVGANPYFHVDPLRNSIPYLVPRAAILLNDIGRAYYDSLQREQHLYYYLLGNGATHLEAVMPFARQAVEKSFAPCIANMAVLGIVSLPGTMIGQILGGSTPGIAIKYQMMITVITFSASMLSLMLTLRLADRRSFDAHGRLRNVRRKS